MNPRASVSALVGCDALHRSRADAQIHCGALQQLCGRAFVPSPRFAYGLNITSWGCRARGIK